MSGLFRNLITLIVAWLARERVEPWSRVSSRYWVSPFDSGTRVLKSDKYLQFAEAAQLDFLVRTNLLGRLVRDRIRFVNSAQLVKFALPVAMFTRVRIDTEIVCADDKCAYFSHALFVGDTRHGEVLVKMKFKRGSITVRPADILGVGGSASKPPHVQAWDQALETMESGHPVTPSELHTERLFSYGTLQLEPVQTATFGRRLSGTSDALQGFELLALQIEDEAVIAISGKAQHSMAAFTGRDSDIVTGKVFAVTPAEIESADGYEVAAVKRIGVTLRSGVRAWVYVDARHAP